MLRLRCAPSFLAKRPYCAFHLFLMGKTVSTSTELKGSFRKCLLNNFCNLLCLVSTSPFNSFSVACLSEKPYFTSKSVVGMAPLQPTLSSETGALVYLLFLAELQESLSMQLGNAEEQCPLCMWTQCYTFIALQL